MELLVNGAPTYCYTGGKAFDASQPTVVFIHGVLHDHSVWILQTRYLAHHGFNVLAVDLPGHSRSAGDPPSSVEEAADFVAALLDAAGVGKAALVGHSWGSLIALEAAARLKNRVSHLVLVGTAFPMRVSQVLLDNAQNAPEVAMQMVNVFSRSTLAPVPSALGPGTWVFGSNRALMRRVLASNPAVNVFYRGFKACDSYANGDNAITQITCPVLFVLGAQDQMTQAKAAQSLIAAAKFSGKAVTVTTVPVGHHQMSEAPDETLFALRDFLTQSGQGSLKL
jgi:pimeloyl-ACP methyl ester carboxylesterase